ncbi:uncharacterized protein [Miscanthus floridulus]
MEPFCFSLQISSCMLIVSSLITTVPPYIDIAPSTGRFGAVPNKHKICRYDSSGEQVSNTKLFVCYIAHHTWQTDIENLFSKYGR